MTFNCTIEDLIAKFLRRETNSTLEKEVVIIVKRQYTSYEMEDIQVRKTPYGIEIWKYKSKEYKTTEHHLEKIHKHIKLISSWKISRFMDNMTADKYAGKCYDLTTETEDKLRNKI